MKTGDLFKEFLYNDRRENIPSDVKIGIVKNFVNKKNIEFVVIHFQRKGQLKVITEIEVSQLLKDGDYWIRK